MDRYLVRRARRLLLAIIGLAVMVSLAPFGHSAASAAPNNLHDVYLYPAGLSGDVHVWLNTAKASYVEIGTTQVPNATPHYLGTYANDLAAVKFNWNPTTYKVFNFTGLKQNTQYWAQITYQDADGSWHTKANQSFKAKKKTVAVSWTNASIIDDSDPLGCGELRFLQQVKVGGDVSTTDVTDFKEGCSGGIVNGISLGHQYDVGDKSLILVGGCEDDDTWENPFVLNTWGLGGFGDMGEHAVKQVQLDTSPWNGQESYGNRPFTVEPNGDSVHVLMHGSYSVFYT